MRDPHAAISRVLFFMRGDLEEIALREERNPRSSFPAILTCFAGMDFLGAFLLHEPRSGNEKRILAFLRGPMVMVDKRYGIIAKGLYRKLRVPLAHCGTVAGYFMVESDASFREKHLTRVNRDGLQYVVLHTASFVAGFLAAADTVQGDLKNRPLIELTETLDEILPARYTKPPMSIPPYVRTDPTPTTADASWGAFQRPPDRMGTCVEDTPGWPSHS
ncbi:MAG TPA: hypothetical protein PLS25_05650 [Methanoregulaceae archaeon]|nr:hypothetical protein [Methanoregulaceae archaeon]